MAIFDIDEAESGAQVAAGEEPRATTVFPGKIVLALAVMIGLLASLRAIGVSAKAIDFGIVAKAFSLHWPSAPAVPLPRVSAVPKAAGMLPPVSPLFVDNSSNLDSFYAALWKLEAAGRTGGVVTILHYGDSPTTADLITGDVRAQLQRRFGDAGRGYTLIAKPWAWYGHRGVEMSGSGWTIRTGVGLIREGIYGLGGAAFEGKPGAWSRFRLTDSEQSAVEIEYLAKPDGGAFVVDADDQPLLEQPTDGKSMASGSVHVPLPVGTKVLSIRPTSGAVTLFGADFRRGTSGLLYDSLGLNGATTSVLARVLEPDLWKQQMARAAPALVIVNYGSNESSFGNFVHNQYGSELLLAIQRIRQAAPNASILIMSPMDRGVRSGLDEIETMSTIPEIVAIQRHVAAETHCAFFDTYDAMGGSGTMARWFVANPRLVTADLLHPTPQGASLVADLFVEQLNLGYDRWKMQHGIALPAAPTLAAGMSALPQPRKAGVRKGKSTP
jgi:lysophospholipase L1-like esterase